MHPNEKFPDPWLYDMDALIKDLDYVREFVLKIPLHNDTHLPTNAAIAALWDLREWQKRAQDGKTPPAAKRTRPARKVASIRGASAA